MRTSLWVVAYTALSACTAEPSRLQTASSTVVALERGGLVTANGVEQTVSLVDTDRQRVFNVSLSGEPSHVATWGDRVWVTLRQSGEVAELRATGSELALVATTYVGPEPVGVVPNQDGSRLYVAVSMDSQVVELDTETLTPLRTVDMPARVQWLALHPGGTLFAAAHDQAHLYHWQVEDAVPSVESTRLHFRRGDGRRVTGNMSLSPGGGHLAVPVLELSQPTPSGHGDYSSAPHVELVYIEAETGTPTGRGRYADTWSMGPISSVTFAGSEDLIFTEPGNPFVERVPLGHFKLTQPPVGLGASGAAVDRSGRVWIHGLFDLTVTPEDESSPPISLGESRLSEQVRHGRELFFTTSDPSITGGSLSCASCHVEGASDNRTWNINDGLFQTPSLAGGIAATSPMTWAKGVASVAAEAEEMSTGPMEGDGDADYAAVAAFVETLRQPSPPTPVVSDEVLALGRRAFDKAACASCHPAPLFTDNQSHALLSDTRMQTPSLRGLASTAPYLHDGRASTLDEVVTAAVGTMGTPELLSEEERAALVHYLRGL